MADLGRRIAVVEDIRALCGTCEERARTIQMGGSTTAEACRECGRPVEVRTFTIDIDRAEGRDEDAA